MSAHDVVGVGIGPFNLGLAALLDGVPEIDAAFFDGRPAFAWHPGLMLDEAEVQVPFLADLVTLADPCSPHSFLAYLHERGRLYRFYLHERWHAQRREFDDYYRWAAERLESCRFGARVEEVRPRPGGGWTVALSCGEEHVARAVVLGVGGVPAVPACARALLGEQVLHSAEYGARRASMLGAGRVAVVGSGQSAAEVVADLLDHAPATRVTWFTRGAGFLAMEYSKLGLEHFSPEYAAHFHGLEPGRRDALRAGQDLLYKGISASTSERIYDALYRRSIGGAEPDVAYAARCELRDVHRTPAGALRLVLHHLDAGTTFALPTDVLVLGTGYDAAQPPVPGLAELAQLDEHGRPVVEADRRIRLRDGSASTLFVQGADLHSHGVGAPDLGLGAHRNAVIVNALCGREVYAVRERNVFQTFGVPGSAELRCAEPAAAAVGPPAAGSAGRMSVPHAELVDALTRDRWERVNRELVAKLLTELAFEDVIAPSSTELADGRRACVLALGERLVLRYEAHCRPLGDWRAEPATIRATLDGADVALPDAADVVALGAPAVGADPATAAGLVGEVAMTALGDVLGAARGRPAAQLLDLDALELECELRGHPWIVASKGRVGFGAGDLLAYAPEAARPVQLGWLAADPAIAQRSSIDGLSHETVVREQVGEEAYALLRARAAAAGLDPDSACYLPVHPWQWEHRVLTLHAGAIARGELVALGTLDAAYLPGQSLRTLAEIGRPERRHLKLALSILNTSVYRGLPRARTLAAPALTQWLCGLCAADPFLRETGLVMLGEVASVSVAHSAFEAIADVPYQHTEMLGAIWREPVAAYLRAGERAITMAALIHRDGDGVSFAELLIERSGVGADAWVRRLHEVTLPPLLHVLYRFGATFSPHAQNCLVVLDEHDVPVRLVVKDFVDDAMISSEALPELASMPAEVRAALGQGVEAMLLAQWIQCGLLVCVHRYLAEILEERMGYDEGAFWRGAERAVAAYHERFEDELGLRFELFDVEAPAFVKLCLNRVRILGRGYADGPDRPVASASGWIDNPLAPATHEVAR